MPVTQVPSINLEVSLATWSLASVVDQHPAAESLQNPARVLLLLVLVKGRRHPFFGTSKEDSLTITHTGTIQDLVLDQF